VKIRKTLPLLAGLLLAISAVHGQWLEQTIYLPDSLSGLVGPTRLVYNSANNTIYVGGEYGDCVIAIDGAFIILPTIPFMSVENMAIV